MPLQYLIFLTVLTPVLAGGLNLIFHKNANVRDGVTLLGALITFYFSIIGVCLMMAITDMAWFFGRNAAPVEAFTAVLLQMNKLYKTR